MRVVLLVVAVLLASVLAIGTVVAGPSWLSWPASVFAVLLLLAAASQWSSREKQPIGWLLPLALMFVAVVAVASASPGATTWVLWPVLVAALVAIAAGLTDVLERRRRRSA